MTTAIVAPSRAGEAPGPGIQSPAFGGLPVVEARVLFVSFPPDGVETNPSDALVPWAGWLIDELRDFVAAMSRGQQRLEIEIVERLGPDANKAWRAAHPASHYRNDANPCPCTSNRPCSGCSLLPTYATLNNEIMTAVHDAYRDAGITDAYWEPVHMVFVIAYQSPFSSPTLGGIAKLGSVHVEGSVVLDVPGFTECTGDDCGYKRGETQRLFPSDFNGLPYNHRVAGAAAHELGHVLTGLHHAPKSGNPPSGPMPACGNPEPANYVNVGAYDMMRGFGDARWTQVGIVPMHPRWLDQPQFRWVPTERIDATVRDLRVPQIRGPEGKSFVIVEAYGNTTQSFLFANYQGAASSRFDAKLGGEGLLIWHILATAPEPPFSAPPVDQAWDLESAAGKKPTVEGKDVLEGDWCALGSGADFFGSAAGGVDFSATTNPNSNLYADLHKDAAQSVPSSIGIENIRADPAPGSTDMLVDVYLDPRQYVLAPNGGEVLPPAMPLAVRWQVRPWAGIQFVDVEWSADGGATFAMLAPAQPNTGSYTFTPTEPCAACRVRVTSYDAMTRASDVSDADFAVGARTGTPPPATQPLFVHAVPNPFNPTTRISFGVDRQAVVRLTIFDVDGREVRCLAAGEFAPGTYWRDWDGRDAAGRRVGSRAFAYRLTVGEAHLDGKLVLVR